MSGFESPDSGAAAIVFLVLYVFYLIAAGNILRQTGWKNRYTLLVAYGLIRLGSQISGIGFAILGIEHWQWLIAYLVLGAEGYFVLVLFTFHMLAQAQREHFGWSWIRPTKEEKRKIRTDKNNSLIKRFFGYLTVFDLFHYLLIPANVLIIYGGTSTAGKTSEELDADPSILPRSKILRAVGQGFFLGQTIFIVIMAIYAYFVEKIQNLVQVFSIFLVSPFLTVRGIFGILSIYINSMNYYNLSNYDAHGLNSKFVAYEYVLGTTMEFISASILIYAFYWQKRRDSKRLDSSRSETIEVEESFEKSHQPQVQFEKGSRR